MLVLLHPTPTPLHLFPSIHSTSPTPIHPPKLSPSTRMDGIGTMATTTLVLRSHFQTAEVYYHNINQYYMSDDSLWDMDVGVAAEDDKVVDQFLDLGGIPDETDERDFATCVVNLDGQNSDHRNHDQDNENNTSNSGVSFGDIELAPPTEDISDLEWVSKIVDDTISDIPYFQHTTHSIPKAIQTPKFPSKPRSKRPKLAHKTWWSSSRLPQKIKISPPIKNRKGRKPRMSQENETRRCSHCGVNKTPQWRAGPVGPKTLCNACGVRYKSGRLLPEYRPAISPTFMHHVHSNSHRKVLEMRRNKEHSLLVF